MRIPGWMPWPWTTRAAARAQRETTRPGDRQEQGQPEGSGRRQGRSRTASIRIQFTLSLHPVLDEDVLARLEAVPRGQRAAVMLAALRAYSAVGIEDSGQRKRWWRRLLSQMRWPWMTRGRSHTQHRAAGLLGGDEGTTLVLRLDPEEDRRLLEWLRGMPRALQTAVVLSVLRQAMRERLLDNPSPNVPAYTGQDLLQQPQPAAGERQQLPWLETRPLDMDVASSPVFPHPWDRGMKLELWCVQHMGAADADAVPYPVWVHNEALHPGMPCSGPGHSGYGFCRHEWAMSPFGAVARVLGVDVQRVRWWWRKGWVAVNGQVATARKPTPPAGMLRLLPAKGWKAASGAAPPVAPRSPGRVPLEWCVRGVEGVRYLSAAGPFAIIHACQDHAGQECPPPPSWLPSNHVHRHVITPAPSSALTLALEVPRATAQRWAYDPGMVCLEGPTPLWFRERRQRRAGEGAPAGTDA